MKIFTETERLILREILPIDESAFFEMDSDPEVHKYLGNKPITEVDQIKHAIQFIRQQYIDYGIGRWAIIEKATNEFVGWGGLKWVTSSINNHINFYDVGYRLARKHWRKGYATECAIAAVNYGFEQLNASNIYGITHIDNLNSAKALEKSGLTFVETFNHEDMLCNWYQITHNDWLKRKPSGLLK